MKYDARQQMTPKDAIHLPHITNGPPDVIVYSHAVAECAREIAERYNERHRNPTDIDLMIAGALLHDIGRARSNGIDHAGILSGHMDRADHQS